MKQIEEIKKDWYGFEKIKEDILGHMNDIDQNKRDEKSKCKEHQRRIEEHLRKTKKYVRCDLEDKELQEKIEKLQKEINSRYEDKYIKMTDVSEKKKKLRKLEKKIGKFEENITNKIRNHTVSEQDFEELLKWCVGRLVNIKHFDVDKICEPYLRQMKKEIKKTCGIDRYD